LYLENRGGPAFSVEFANEVLQTVGCNTGAELTPGQNEVPQLPWELALVRVRDGSTILVAQVTELPRYFTQIGEDPESSLGSMPVAGPPGPTCPPEISRERAIELAKEHTNLETLVSAEAGLFADLNTNPRIGPGYDIGGDDVVWAVAFSGDIEICPPPPPAPTAPSGTSSPRGCYLRRGTATVFLDYSTGAFRATQVQSPA
jgi:hypothetical protein